MRILRRLRRPLAGGRPSPRIVPILLAASVALGFVGLSGCNDKSSTKPSNNPPPVWLPSAEARPDFHLPDVNPHSARYNQQVSPRDYLGKVSAWYFGHST